MLQLILAMMVALHPDAPRTGAAPAFARAIAYVVEHDAPIDGVGRELGAALLVTFAWEEGRFGASARRGDGGVAACSLQVHASTEARRRELERDPIACVRAGYAVLRESYRRCSDARGYCGSCFAKDDAPAAIIAKRRARTAQGILSAAAMTLAAP